MLGSNRYVMPTLPLNFIAAHRKLQIIMKHSSFYITSSCDDILLSAVQRSTYLLSLTANKSLFRNPSVFHKMGEAFATRIMLLVLTWSRLDNKRLYDENGSDIRSLILLHTSCFLLGVLILEGASTTPDGGVWGLLARKSSAFSRGSESHWTSASRELRITKIQDSQ